jgi:hypothetical protein
MRKISFLMMSFILAALSLASCSSKTPVEEFAQAIRDISDKMKDCKTVEEIQKFAEDNSGAFDKFKEPAYADYVLTQEDKDSLISAYKYYTQNLIDVFSNVYGEEVPESAKEDAIMMISDLIGKCKTLGDVIKYEEKDFEDDGALDVPEFELLELEEGETPVTAYVKAISDVTEGLKQCTDEAMLNEYGQQISGTFDKFSDPNYADTKLTQEDKKLLINAFQNFTRQLVASFNVIYPDGAEQANSELAKGLAAHKAAVDSLTTFGQVATYGNSLGL